MRARNSRLIPAPLATAALVVLAATTAVLAGTNAFAAGGSGGVDTTSTSSDPADPSSATTGGRFPVRGPHTYGDGLGAGRGHQGQDILADCGRRVVAAQPGRVQVRASQAGAGNYVVIDGKGELNDTVYMHLQPGVVARKRQRVAAGDLIGRVGDTGRASTCHLHFEMWSEPGWYEGGSPIDPKPYLKRWDTRR